MVRRLGLRGDGCEYRFQSKLRSGTPDDVAVIHTLIVSRSSVSAATTSRPGIKHGMTGAVRINDQCRWTAHLALFVPSTFEERTKAAKIAHARACNLRYLRARWRRVATTRCDRANRSVGINPSDRPVAGQKKEDQPAPMPPMPGNVPPMLPFDEGVHARLSFRTGTIAVRIAGGTTLRPAFLCSPESNVRNDPKNGTQVPWPSRSLQQCHRVPLFFTAKKNHKHSSAKPFCHG